MCKIKLFWENNYYEVFVPLRSSFLSSPLASAVLFLVSLSLFFHAISFDLFMIAVVEQPVALECF